MEQKRLASVDILRGLIMVIMALDHVRDFFGPAPFRPEDISQTTVPLFFTRWVTHLCAPLFLFLSGYSAYLYTRKRGQGAGTRFLLTRGLWLLAVELLVMTFLLQWNYNMLLLSILWAIGWSMILLAPLVRLPGRTVLIISLALLFLLALLPAGFPTDGAAAVAGLLHHSPFLITLGSWPVLVAYTVLGWAVAMALGYGFGAYTEGAPAVRLKAVAGAAALLLFIVLRLINSYGDPQPWAPAERGAAYTFLSFLNVSKYPPSLQFLLLMLGLGLLIWSAIERSGGGAVGRFLAVYGRVPFFFFVLHFALGSGGSWLWTRLSFGQATNLSFTQPAQWPPEYSFSLPRVYLAWMAVVLLMYFPCRWFGQLKARSSAPWLSYL